MITQAYLTRIFVRMGYAPNEESCKRRLADWRQKDLLPPLKVKGRQHHGKIYYWDNSEITAQAVTVYKLFELYPRAKWVLLSTWFAGYDVPLHKVRKIWIGNLEVEINHFESQVRRNEEMVDVLSRELDGKLWRQKRKPNPILQSEFYISLISNTFYNPDFDLDDLGDESDIEKLFLLLCPTVPINGRKITDLIDIKSISNFLNEHFSLMARYELIKNCPDETFEQVHHNWRRAKPILGLFNRIISPNPAKMSKEKLQFLLLIGNCFIMMNLILRKLGYGLKFENALNELCDVMPIINADEMREKIQVQKSIADYDHFDRLYQKIISIWEHTPMDKSMEFNLENHGQ